MGKPLETATEQASAASIRVYPHAYGETHHLQHFHVPPAVYPHAYGETYYIPAGRPPGRGLSPRVWGNLGVVAEKVRDRGSIPTRMGKPPLPCHQRSLLGVYPHAYGETLQGPYTTDTNMGLSPRVWGNPFHQHRNLLFFGSIPTRMGKPLGARQPRFANTVYPHAYGETADNNPSLSKLRGLSPRVWGNPVRVPRVCRV